MGQSRIVQRVAAAAVLVAAGCSLSQTPGFSARERVSNGWYEQRMVVSEAPPVIAAERPEDVALVRLGVARLDRERMLSQLTTRRVAVPGLPWLAGSPEGRAFVTSTPRRALARGMPRELCPASFLATGTGTAEAVATDAVAGCLERVGSRPGCGCRLVALDDMVLVPRSDLAYSTGIPARMRIGGSGDGLFVAEENAVGTIELRDLLGTIGRVERGEGERVRVTLARDEAVFEGISIPVGYRRGRVAERIYAEGEGGRRLVLLLGFDPQELAQHAGRWLAWPADLKT